MYAKVIVTLCAVGLARAGGLLGAGPLAYNTIAAPAVITKTIAPAVSSISAYSTKQTHPSPILKYAPAVATYAAAPAIATYAAAPAVISKTISPAVNSISAYSTNIVHGSPRTYAAYATPTYGGYAAPAAYGAYGAPAIGAYSAPLLKGYATAPINSYAVGAPLLKSSLAYSGVPSLYSGYGANYDWC